MKFHEPLGYKEKLCLRAIRLSGMSRQVLAVLTVPQIQELISQYPDIAAIINGTVIVILRWITTSAIFNKAETPQPKPAKGRVRWES